ncbi:MAG: hypothetical protein HWQ35_11100 [Nostoc sp. NMS1]|uniref:hypothetical protein n=1 Tax=unclassified Nostoc TaxID=2593658 RepID=UPI0025F6B09D|nr:MULTISPECIES: hypothetical protein [unclassified Nostoc]MBN3907079.1 hypothetical protein [Nostoc sp. NMS1]MBN3992991.1 hypothetical protein [Nostoc sp. NMS2]
MIICFESLSSQQDHNSLRATSKALSYLHLPNKRLWYEQHGKDYADYADYEEEEDEDE